MSSINKDEISQWQSEGAIYGSGDQLRLFWGKAEKSAELKTYPAVFSSDFYLEEAAPWHSYTHEQTLRAGSQCQSAEIDLQWQAPDFELFKEQFLKSKKLLQSGEVQKIVLTTQVRAPKTLTTAPFLQRALGEIPEQRYLYGLWSQDQGFLGYTPEILLKIEDQQTVTTMALAGTSPLESLSQSLSTSKNQQEHDWVIQDICRHLEPLGAVTVGETRVLSLQTLAHLLTPISLHLKQSVELNSLIERFHPTAALGVFPRSFWKQLKKWRSDYGSFGAPFILAESESHVVGLVGIRQLAWDKNFYYIRSGCGVVNESCLDDEWKELLLKIDSVKKMMGCRL